MTTAELFELMNVTDSSCDEDASSGDDTDYASSDEDGGEVHIVSPKMGRKEHAHHVMMHVGEDVMDKTLAHHATMDLKWHKDERLGTCHDCPAGKAKQLPVKKRSAGSVKPNKGDRAHSDMSGKLGFVSPGGAKYTHTIIENTSRAGWVCGMRRKSELAAVIENWICDSAVGVNADVKLKELMCDNDQSNYKAKRLNNMLKKRHVKRCPTPEYKAAYNGIAESNQGTIDGMAQAALHYALPSDQNSSRTPFT